MYEIRSSCDHATGTEKTNVTEGPPDHANIDFSPRTNDLFAIGQSALSVSVRFISSQSPSTYLSLFPSLLDIYYRRRSVHNQTTVFSRGEDAFFNAYEGPTFNSLNEWFSATHDWVLLLLKFINFLSDGDFRIASSSSCTRDGLH